MELALKKMVRKIIYPLPYPCNHSLDLIAEQVHISEAGRKCTEKHAVVLHRKA